MRSAQDERGAEAKLAPAESLTRLASHRRVRRSREAHETRPCFAGPAQHAIACHARAPTCDVDDSFVARQQSPGMQESQTEPQLPTAARWLRPGPVTGSGEYSIDWQLLQSDIAQDNLALQRQSERAVWLLESW